MKRSASAPWTSTAFGVDENGGSPIVIKGVRRGRRVTFTPSTSAQLNDRTEQAALVGCMLQRETFIRWLTAPIASPRKAETVFPSLLDIQLPFSIEECEISLLEMRPSVNPIGTQGLLTGARAADIEKKLATLASLGMDPHILDQEGMALWSQGLEEYPVDGSDTAGARILVYISLDRVTLVAGHNGAFIGAFTMRQMDTGQVLRMLKSLFPESPATTQWFWTGPAATQSQAKAYQESLSSLWPGPTKIVHDPDTFLARALVTRALLPGPARCNLRSGRFLHPTVTRQYEQQPYRWAAACLAAGLLLCAVNVAWMVTRQHQTSLTQKELRALAIEITGTSLGLQSGQEAVSTRRAMETQAKDMEPFLASVQAPLNTVLVTILSKAKEAGISVENMTLSRKNGVLHGLAPKMEQGEKLARSLDHDGWTTTIERKDAPAGDERVAFVIGMGRSREKR